MEKEQRKRSTSFYLLLFIPVLTLSTFSAAADGENGETAISIGTKRQLFIDNHLIERMDNVSLRLHHPRREGTALRIDRPYEKGGLFYATVFKDGDHYRMYYRATESREYSKAEALTCYAESTDGIRWEKPDLGIIEYSGSRLNNIVWREPGRNMMVMKDPRKDIPESERYKALVRVIANRDVDYDPHDGGYLSPDSIKILISKDGLHWELGQEEPILSESPLDTHSVLIWDEEIGKYVIFTRGIRHEGKPGRHQSRSFDYLLPEGSPKGMRFIRRSTSSDARNWSKLEFIDTGLAPLEHLYNNAAIRYPRAPHYTLMFPSRFVNTREPKPGWKYGPGVNDVVLLSSRDGIHFDRTFMEAFIRPGRDQGNWHERSLYVERGLIRTSPDEYSFFGAVNWRLDTQRIIRYSIRLDGFASVNAPYEGGEFQTRSLVFEGDKLLLNFATSAAGGIRIQIEDQWGNPISGFTFEEFPEVFGDHIDKEAGWDGGKALGSLSGQIVRLRFRMNDSDLYSLKFAHE